MNFMVPGKNLRDLYLGNLFTLAFDNTGTNGNTIYVGSTKPGNIKSASKWKIQKITYDANDNPTDIQWPNGDNSFSYVWDDRATYTYS